MREKIAKLNDKIALDKLTIEQQLKEKQEEA